MRRQTSLLFLGIFAAAAGAQVAACSSDDSDQGGSGGDAGSDSGQIGEQDTGTVVTGTPGCNGPLPVMTIRGDGGTQAAPDWSCYASGGSFYDLDDAGDAGLDAADAADAADASDAALPADSGTDAAIPPTDSGTDASTAGDYQIHVTDFNSQLPPGGATIDLFWGNSTEGTIAFTGTVDSNGILAYPAPPAGTATLSYFLHASTTQEPLYWHAAPVIPPGVNVPNLGNGRFEGNSVSTVTETSLLTAVFGSESPRTDLAIVVTSAVDCRGNDVQGAQFTVFDSATSAPLPTDTGAGSPRTFYFKDNLPATQCTYTNNLAKGVWVMANAPTNEPGNTHTYTLRMTGRMTDSDPATGVTLDEVALELHPGALSVARPFKYNGPPPNVP